jgi:hypothetical protein
VYEKRVKVNKFSLDGKKAERNEKYGNGFLSVKIYSKRIFRREKFWSGRVG